MNRNEATRGSTPHPEGRSSTHWWAAWRRSLLPSPNIASTPLFLHTGIRGKQRVEAGERDERRALHDFAIRRAPIGLMIVEDFRTIVFANDQAKQQLLGARDGAGALRSLADLERRLRIQSTSMRLSQILRQQGTRNFSIEALSDSGSRFQIMINQCGASGGTRQVSVLSICDISSVLDRHFDIEENVNFVSHDIRFMLNTILLQAEQLKNQLAATLPQVAINSLANITQRAKQSLALTEAFLEWRLLNRQKSISMHSVDFVEIVSSACEEMKIQSRQSHVAIDFECEDRILVTGNFALLYRCTLNLLSNAVLASQNASRVSVGISVTRDAVSLTVRDRGNGFPADVLTAFSTREGVLPSQPGKGASGAMRGLGLQMARKVAQVHSGDFRLSNAHDGGAIVEIALPRLLAQEIAATSNQSPRSA